MIPVRNATLTAVSAGGFAADYDQPAGTGTIKWTGSERVYWSEVTEREEVTGRTTDLDLRRYLIVDEGLPVSWLTGDSVTVTYRDAVRSGTVRDVQVTTADGLSGVVRLTLEDA